MTIKKSTLGLLIICILTIGISSANAGGGNPFDKIEATFEEVKTDLANIWSVVTGEDGLQTRVETLEAEIVQLETLIESMSEGPAGPPGMLSEPDYDTGWISLGGVVLEMDFNLEETDTFVYLIGRYYIDGFGYTVHQRDIGSNSEGRSWSMRPKLIDEVGDEYVTDPSKTLLSILGANTNRWEEFRVMVWIIPTSSP